MVTTNARIRTTPRLQRVWRESMALSQRHGEVLWDERGAGWVLIKAYRLPPGFGKQATAVLIDLPDSYPQTGPDGFFLDADLRDKGGRHLQHLFSDSRYNPYADRGWAWYCLHPRNWNPAADIWSGDNLVSYAELMYPALEKALKWQ